MADFLVDRHTSFDRDTLETVEQAFMPKGQAMRRGAFQASVEATLQ